MAVSKAATLKSDLEAAKSRISSFRDKASQSGLNPGADTSASTTTTGGLNPEPEESYDVADIAADIASTDSTIMQRAATEGLQQANSRGLLNSSMAVGESQGAVLDRAVEMASQTSDQRHQAAMSEQEYEQAKKLSQQEGRITSKLSAQESKQEQQSIALAAKLDEETKIKLAQMEIDANDARAAESMITSMLELYQEEVRSILANPDIGSDERQDMLAAAGELVSNEMAMIENLFAIDVDWDTGDITYTTGGSSGGSSSESSSSSGGGDDDYVKWKDTNFDEDFRK